MAGMLEWYDQEFKTTVINTLTVLIDKVDGMQEQVDNVSRETENPKKEPKRNLEIKMKTTVTE